jgi:hypothetical protein
VDEGRSAQKAQKKLSGQKKNASEQGTLRPGRAQGKVLPPRKRVRNTAQLPFPSFLELIERRLPQAPRSQYQGDIVVHPWLGAYGSAIRISDSGAQYVEDFNVHRTYSRGVNTRVSFLKCCPVVTDIIGH